MDAVMQYQKISYKLFMQLIIIKRAHEFGN